LSDRGHAAVELGLAVGVLLLPAALAVLAFGPWSERRVFAEAAAAEAARAAVIELDSSAGTQVVMEMTANQGLSNDLVRLDWCGADGSGPAAVSDTCSFDRGSVVTAEVQVWVPLIATPWGDVGGLWVGASHSEPVDLYRSLP
jgi:Flp pilus assembly protein TadG